MFSYTLTNKAKEMYMPNSIEKDYQVATLLHDLVFRSRNDACRHGRRESNQASYMNWSVMSSTIRVEAASHSRARGNKRMIPWKEKCLL